jgi:hypothetical protein
MRPFRLPASVLLVVSTSCSLGVFGDEASFQNSADTLRFAGRVTLRSQKIPSARPFLTYEVTLLTGDGLSCPLEPNAARLASATKPISLHPDGTFQRAYRTYDFKSPTHPDCSIIEFRTDATRSLRVQASLPADAASCRIYCREDEGTCIDDCLLPGRSFLAVTRVDGKDLPGRVTRELPNAFRTELPLDLDHLSPPPGGDAAPDLVVNARSLEQSITFETREFGPGDCAREEGCITGTGPRRLIRFDTEIINRGGADLVLGDPAQSPGYHYDACHDHYHLESVMRYELLPLDGEKAVAVGD